jgi:DNA replication protein DnaC
MEKPTHRIENIDFQEIADRCMASSRNVENNIYKFTSEFQEKKNNPEKSCGFVYGIPKAYVNCSFDNFQGNEKLISDLKQINHEDGIVLRGNTGCGKTHLAIAIAKAIPTEWHSIKGDVVPGAVFTTTPELLLKIRSSFREDSKESEENLINYYSGGDLLILDDLGSEKTTDFAITTLYIIIDRRIRECRQTIITTNLSQEEIEKVFGARISSRLAGMVNIKINMPDYRKKRG